MVKNNSNLVICNETKMYSTFTQFNQLSSNISVVIITTFQIVKKKQLFVKVKNEEF